MQKKDLNLRIGTLSIIIIAAAAMRLFPHPVGFAPIGAMALFGGAYFGKKWQSFFIPLTALWISDIALNYAFYHNVVLFHDMFLWVYGAFALNVLIGKCLIKKVKVSSITSASLIAALMFYLITNLGVWMSTGLLAMYPHTPAGLFACYVAGLPYLGGSVLSNLFYSGLFFGTFEFFQKKYPALSLNA
ncbi:MAG: hypothetical protein Q8880_05015 [Bacteroidota bacterium]|nr:hypothetical protein [Bacteroidota bacterium]